MLHPPLPVPKDLALTLHSTYATIHWDAVPGATKYDIMLTPIHVIGPFTYEFTSSATSINISYLDFPYYKSNAGYGWYIQVAAANKSGVSTKFASSKTSVKVSTTGTRVVAKKSTVNAVVAKLKSCLNSGEAGALGGAAATGVMALASIWVPGANAVTASSVLVAMAAGAAGSYVVCLAS